MKNGALDTDAVTLEANDGDISFDSDTIFAVQLDIIPHRNLWFTVQLASKGYRPDGTSQYKPRIEWAYVSYKPKPGWKIHLGEMQVPYFVHSESIEVGFAYPLARPPIDAYTYYIKPFSNHQGIDITHTSHWDDYQRKYYGGNSPMYFLSRR